MTDPYDEPELRARLRATDPAASLGPADPDGVARLLEDVMSHDIDTQVPETRQSGTRGRNPLTWVVAAAATLVIAGIGVFAIAGGPDDADPPAAGGDQEDQVVITQLRAPAAAGGRCMVPTAEVLAGQDLAFAGTVDAITDGTVTLTPTETFAGEEADTVEVEAPAAELTDLIGAVDFEVGGSYLVAASDGQVTACGFSGPASPQLERLYTQAFGG